MKPNCTILSAFIVASACLLWIGCEGQAVAAEEPKPELTAPEAVTDSVKAEAAPAFGKGGPVIKFEKVVHDFGNIGPRSKNFCEFKFANTGDRLLKIKNVSKTCGCTPYTLAKKEYEPGESGTLKVRYNASKRAGSVKKILFVYSNDEVKSKVELAIKANIVEKIHYQPKKLVLLLNKENAGCPEIMIRSVDGKQFSINKLKVIEQPRSAKDVITVDYDSSAKATEFVLQPKVDLERLQEKLGGRIEITVTHPESGVITIPFEVLPRFKFTPPSLIVYKAEPEKPVTRHIWILSNYDEDFEVESTSSQKDTIKVLNQEKIDNRYEFELEITPPPSEKDRFFTDKFFVDIKGSEKLEIVSRVFYPKKAKK